MDEFGVLTEGYGLKRQGKSAPMARSRRPTSSNDAQTWNFGTDSGLNPKSPPYSSRSNSNSDYGLFQSGSNGFPDDIFGGAVKPAKQSESSAFNLDSIFSGSNAKSLSSNRNNDAYDVFDGMPGLKSSGSSKINAYDVFDEMPGLKSSGSAKSNAYDVFDEMPGLKSSGSAKSNAYDVFDEMPGLKTSGSSKSNAYDVFDGMPGLTSSGSTKSNAKDDIFGSFASVPKNSAPVDDLLGDFSGVREKLHTLNVKNDKNVDKSGGDFGDLIPGFGGSTPSNNGTRTQKNSDQQSTVHSTKSNLRSSLEEDPFVVLESVPTSTSTPAYDFTVLEQISKLSNSQDAKLGGSSDSSTKLKSPPKSAQVSKGDKGRSSGVSSTDELFRSTSAPRSRVTTVTNNTQGSRPQNRAPSSSNMKKSSSVTDMFQNLFPEDEETEEVDGESNERRIARLGRLHRSKERESQAVADMKQRDRQAQREQEEKRRIAETLDMKVKSWSYGKEGNMRALLSSLQCVLWPESGWEPVSLTDLITSGAVKKVYFKATLCVHPDKVQQKGATLEQKCTAEKVFDILKEGWEKFKKQELR